MSLVLDPSLALSWFFEDERTRVADIVLDQVARFGAVVPSLWRIEVANGLQVAVRRKRIDAAFRDQVLARLAALPITVDHDGDLHAWTTTLSLAERFGLTLYDSAYLDLAHRGGLPLATLDRALRSAASVLQIALLGHAE